MLWKQSAEVLVVGAGPVGMMAALMLAERGIRVEIIDREVGSGRHNYALVLQRSSLRLLDDAGIAARVLARGAPIDTLVIHDRRRGQPAVPLGAPKNDFPFLLALPCWALEDVLEQRLRELKVPIRWSHRFAGLDDAADRVAVTVETLAVESGGYPIGGHVFSVDKTKTSTFAYVIGADGHNSIVRRRLGIDVEPSGEPQGYVAMERISAVDLGREIHAVVDETTTDILWPLPGGRCRWTVQIAGDRDPPDGKRPITEREIAELLAARAPWFAQGTTGAGWTEVLHFEPAVAQRFRHGRAWLAGDAAHVTGAFGIPGLNDGLQEAHDLASRIARVLRGAAGGDVLDAYNETLTEVHRRPLPSGPSAALIACLAGPGADAERLGRDLALALAG